MARGKGTSGGELTLFGREPTKVAVPKPAAKPRDSGTDQDRPEPQRHARIEAAIEEHERQRARRNEEDPDPDGPVRETIAGLVPLANRAIARQLYALGMAEVAFV